jgi:hypothetical protein
MVKKPSNPGKHEKGETKKGRRRGAVKLEYITNNTRRAKTFYDRKKTSFKQVNSI